MIARDHGTWSQAAIIQLAHEIENNRRLVGALQKISDLPSMPWSKRARSFMEAKEIARAALLGGAHD